jgi:hypothetical protein
MYCLVLWAYFREHNGVFPLESFEIITQTVDAESIEKTKRELRGRWSRENAPTILVHGIYKL